jgi:ABC-2 type transport system permease protein
VPDRRLAPVPPMLVAQTRAQLLQLLRSPIYSMFSLALPIIFWLFFGLPNAHRVIGGVNGGAYLLASFGAYAVANVMLFTFGINIAVERGRKQDLLMRATPLRPAVYLAARVASAIVFALAAVVLLSLFAVVTGGVRLTAEQWVTLVLRLLIGSLPLLLLGFAIGYLVSSNSAAAVVNLIALPMFFASGIFVPVSALPAFIQTIAPYLPTYRYGQLAWGAVGAPADPASTDLLWLAGYTVLFLAVTLRAYRAEESRKFS